MMHFWRFCVVSLAVLRAGLGSAAEPVFRIESIQGPEESALIASFSSAGLRLSGSSERVIPVSELVSFRRLAPVRLAPEPRAMVILSAGDRLACDPVSADGELLTVAWPLLAKPDPFTIPLEHVQTIIFQMPPSDIQRRRMYRSLALERQEKDMARLDGGDRMAGEFQSFDARDVRFSGPRGELRLARGKVVALQFDPELVTAPKLSGLYFLLSFLDGSRLFAKQFEMTKDNLQIVTLFGAELVVKREDLVGCQVYHERIQPLSLRAPSHFQETPYLSHHWGWVKNRNVWYGPLRIGDREFGLGMGVHSRSELTYELEPNDRVFRAVVGIDHAAAGAGSVVFSVLLDGKVAWTSPVVTGKSEPLSIPAISLQGKRQLTLLADFGELGDISDYADWCDPIIIRDR